MLIDLHYLVLINLQEVLIRAIAFLIVNWLCLIIVTLISDSSQQVGPEISDPL